MVKVFSWNCRGAKDPKFLSTFKLYVVNHKPDIVCIVEPRISGDDALNVIKQMGYDTWKVSDAVGFSGGIWVLWNNSYLQMEELDKHKQFLNLKCSMANKDSFQLTAVYASPNEHERGQLWEAMRGMERRNNLPWLITGDFNSISRSWEKQGGAGFCFAKARAFNSCIEDCGLIDLGFSGPKFTWFTKGSRIKERLDRSLCNIDWQQQFPMTTTLHLPKLKSDRRPILTYTSEEPQQKNLVRRFHFFASWLSHDNFFPFLESCWKGGSDFPSALQSISEALQKWNKEVYGNIFRRKKQLLNELKSLEMLNERRPSRSSLAREQEVRVSLEHTLWEEELLWTQKARANWVLRGDMNTRFFHNSFLSRRRRNKITTLKDDQGNWVVDEDSLQKLAREYFLTLFSKDSDVLSCCVPVDFPVLDNSLLNKLNQTPSCEEVRATVMAMNGLKAPGKDGFQAIFYQKCWTLIGADFSRFICSCFVSPSKIQSLNETLLTLIPKVENPTSMNQFRPISLCNVGYKVVTKILANWLKPLMPTLVKNNQS
ncbi:unnamed protein product [Linum trigynum]|uniref:Endonuclease/exonuclease/phosphatase domain-containing protein n=1 Tax=Linum trigynum TaxID=586398 RepID=A0AAV2EG65_9ROSI